MSTSKLPPQHMLDAIRVWVETESPTSSAEGVNAMMDLVEKEVAGLPVLIERFSGQDGLGDIVVLRAGPDNGEKAVLLLSHLDTVHPLGTLAEDLPWQIDGDRVYGPGIYDMKASAYIALQAFKQAIFNGGLKRPLIHVFTPDEEIGSPMSRALIETLAEKSAHVLVTEPSRGQGRVVTSRKGVGQFNVMVEGKPSHAGSFHEEGVSAVNEAARQILDIAAMTDYTAGVTTNVGLLSGGTAANVVAQYCAFQVDLRVTNVADGEAFSEKLLALKAHDPNAKVMVEGGMNRPPFERSAAVAALYDVIREVGTELGQDIGEVARVGGGSDGNFTAALGIATVDGLGVDGAGMHTLNEYIELSSLEPRRMLLQRLLERLAGA